MVKMGSTFVRHKGTPEERFWQKVEKTDTCWLWRATLNHAGYGVYRVYKTPWPNAAHQWAWMFTYGDFPEGKEIDHLCRVRNCVRPDHLEAVTRAENVARRPEFLNHHALRTHCKSGHEFTAQNTRYETGRGRRCLECAKRYSEEKRLRRSASA